MNARRPGRLRRPALWLAAILVGLAIGVAADVVRSGGPSAWLARHRLPQPYDARGRVLDVGGRGMYLDCRGTGSPTVVLEAGSGSDSSTWSAVHDDLAATTRTCAYDRAGRARSEPRGRHTLADAAADLRVLLAVGGETPPFVLVGHSLGGAYVRIFADRQRADVVGLVLVDTFDPDLQEAWIHPLLGSLEPEYVADLEALRGIVTEVDGLDWSTSEIQLRASDVAGLPIEVLVAARYEPRLDPSTNTAIVAARAAGYESLSPGRVHLVTAYGSGHLIQIDRPDLVVEAVRRVVAVAGT